MTIIDLKAYLPLDQSQDATYGVLRAMQDARKVDEPCLLFPKGVWHFYPDKAYEAYCFMSNNDGGLKRIPFPIIGYDSLVIDGGGSEFIFHGRISPVVIERSKNITLKNFYIDAPMPFYSQGKVMAVGEGYMDLYIDNSRFTGTVDGDMLVFDSGEWESEANEGIFMVEFDGERNEPAWFKNTPSFVFHGKSKDCCFEGRVPVIRVSQEGENVRLHGDTGIKCNVGNNVFLGFERRPHPCIFMDHSADVLLEDVTIYHSAAMGVIAQLTENITLNRVSMGVREGSGRTVAVGADATHFVNCTGLISMDNCSFFNMMDDATNIHGIYTTVAEILAPDRIMVRLHHYQQWGVELYEPGDKLYFVDRDSMEYLSTATVKDWEKVNCEYFILTLEEPVDGNVKKDMAVELPEKMPAVVLRNIKCGNNRSRGFLISTPKKVVIEDCEFHNSGVGVHFNGDANFWFESGPVRDVTVRNCYFRDCGFGYMQMPVAFDPEVSPERNDHYHQNIVVENNHFSCVNNALVRGRCCQGFIFRNNTWEKSKEYPFTVFEDAQRFMVSGCPDSIIEDVKEI